MLCVAPVSVSAAIWLDLLNGRGWAIRVCNGVYEVCPVSIRGCVLHVAHMSVFPAIWPAVVSGR